MVGTGGWREGERRRRTVCARVHECVSDSIRASWTEKERDGELGERKRNANRTMSVVFVEQGWRTREGEGGEKCVRVRLIDGAGRNEKEKKVVVVKIE